MARFTAVLLACAMMLPAGIAHAKAKKGKGASVKEGKKDDLKAKDYLKMARALVKKGDLETALDYYLQADALESDPSTYFEIGACLEELYRYQEAHTYYKKYIDAGEKASLEKAKEAMAAIEAMPVVLKVITFPEGAAVFIDGVIVTFQVTPTISEVKAGTHTILVKLDGYEDAQRLVNVPYGDSFRVELKLTPGTAEIPIKEPGVVEKKVTEKPEKPEKKEEKGKKEKKEKKIAAVRSGPRKTVPVSLGLAAGATVSTTRLVGSFVDASLGLSVWIKRGFAGIGVDNLVFSDSYLLAAYGAGGYSFRVWKALSIQVSAGLGIAYLHAFEDGEDRAGNVVVASGGHLDLLVHGDIRLGYAIGRLTLHLVPLHASVLPGIGSLAPAPLAQFAFLAGVAYTF
jgi:tetratricopeptide (TPR) repeat protein